MSKSIFRKVADFEFHWAAYHFYATASKVSTAVYLIYQPEFLGDLLRTMAINAHSHRFKAERAFGPNKVTP